jgi:IS4 transposase
MAIVTQEICDEQSRSKSISQFAKDFRLASVLEQSNNRKAKGVGVLTVFLGLLSVSFSGKPLNRLLESKGLEGKKDVFYRFMNSTSANWYHFIRLLSALVLAAVLRFSATEQIPVMILDDTLHKRNRSKEVELLARVRDHNDGRYYRGFRCLTLGYHDGNTFLPIDFRLLSSQKEKTRLKGIRSDIDKRSNGYKARQMALCGSYQLSFDMIARQRTNARYVLFDSWFSEPVMFKTLRKMSLHGIGMLKARKGAFYRFKGKLYSLEAVYAQVNHLFRREHSFVTVGVELRDGTPFSITFVRDQHSKRDWLAIGTTDMSLPGQQVIRLYSRRWNIEVFFKTVKSFLGFAKECQSRSFDAIVCSVAVVFTRYIMLAWQNIGMPIKQTEGQLFFKLFDEMQACTFEEALEIVIRELKKVIVHFDSMLLLSVSIFFSRLPLCFNPLQKIFCCET